MTAAAMSVTLVAPVSAQASTLISVGATGSWTNAPVAALQQWASTHNFADDPVSATAVVEYPASLGFIGMPMGESVAAGATELLRAIGTITGRKIIACESQGCLSVTQLLNRFAADPVTAPLADDLIIVMIGNPATAGGGASAQNQGEYEPFFRITFFGATPESQYETVNVTREYDFFADRPMDDTNALAMWNNLVAFLVVHPNYGDVDMDDPANLIKVVGNTTYVLVPTRQLPMLQSLYDTAEAWKQLTGQADLLLQVEALDARLRAIIDEDYDRTGYTPKGTVGENESLDEPDAAADPEPVTVDDDPPDPTPVAAEPDSTHRHTNAAELDAADEPESDSLPDEKPEESPDRSSSDFDTDTDDLPDSSDEQPAEKADSAPSHAPSDTDSGSDNDPGSDAGGDAT